MTAVGKESGIIGGIHREPSRAHTPRAFIFEATRCSKRTTPPKNWWKGLCPCFSTNTETVPVTYAIGVRPLPCLSQGCCEDRTMGKRSANPQVCSTSPPHPAHRRGQMKVTDRRTLGCFPCYSESPRGSEGEESGGKDSALKQQPGSNGRQAGRADRKGCVVFRVSLSPLWGLLIWCLQKYRSKTKAANSPSQKKKKSLPCKRKLSAVLTLKTVCCVSNALLGSPGSSAWPGAERP